MPMPVAHARAAHSSAALDDRAHVLVLQHVDTVPRRADEDPTGTPLARPDCGRDDRPMPGVVRLGGWVVVASTSLRSSCEHPVLLGGEGEIVEARGDRCWRPSSVMLDRVRAGSCRSDHPPALGGSCRGGSRTARRRAADSRRSRGTNRRFRRAIRPGQRPTPPLPEDPAHASREISDIVTHCTMRSTSAMAAASA